LRGSLNRCLGCARHDGGLWAILPLGEDATRPCDGRNEESGAGIAIRWENGSTGDNYAGRMAVRWCMCLKSEGKIPSIRAGGTPATRGKSVAFWVGVLYDFAEGLIFVVRPVCFGRCDFLGSAEKWQSLTRKAGLYAEDLIRS